MQFIDLKRQQEMIRKELEQNIANVLSHGRYIKGPEIKEIEQRLCHFTGAEYAVSCGNGTDALQISLMALNLEPGDEVITTPFTFFATGEVIGLLKLRPVFVDIEPDTYNIDATKIESQITEKTKAIIAVSLFGQCSDMNSINHIAEKHGLYVIEDAAQSFGATYKNKKSCNLSHMAAASFFPSKPLGCYGDGGMVFTSDKVLVNRIHCIANHGQRERYTHVEIGINSRLDTLQAGILLAKMAVFDEEIVKRQSIGSRYTDLLGSHVKTPCIRPDRTCVYAQYTIEVDDREAFCASMNNAGIPTAVHYPRPLHLQPAFDHLGFREGSFPMAESISKKVVSLPMHPYLSNSDQDLIVEKVKEFC